MIIGMVTSDEARVGLALKGQRGRERAIEAIIDSGFTGALTLPPTLIAQLGLRWRSMDRATLADGSTCVFEVYEARVVWEGKVRRILVAGADAEPLVGMRLLRGHELKMEVRARGKVTIKRLQARRKRSFP